MPLVRNKELQATALVQLAILLEKKERHDEAMKLLDEARALVKIDLENTERAKALLEVLLGYALVDPPRAFTVIEPIVDRTNEDISKLLLVDKIVKSGAVRNGEIIIENPVISRQFDLLKYGPGVVALANSDFNHTKALADRFQRSELRIAGRLILVQSILQNLEKQ